MKNPAAARAVRASKDCDAVHTAVIEELDIEYQRCTKRLIDLDVRHRHELIVFEGKRLITRCAWAPR